MNKLLFLSILVTGSLGLFIYPNDFDGLDKSAHYNFHKFIDKFNKTYSNFNEFNHRFDIFRNNFYKILKHNNRNSQYKLGINQFSDMLRDEVSKYHSCYKNDNYDNDNNKNYYVGHNSLLSTNIDWRLNKTVVNPIKDQGQCGSCYAFSALTTLESAWAIKTGKLYNLAEQQVVDCDKSDNGCNGGLMDNVWDWLHKNGGAMQTKDYHYKATDGSCKFEQSKVVVNVSSYFDVLPNNDTSLALAVQINPVSVGINANNDEFMMYESGIYDNPECDPSPSALDHGVAVVGFTPDYWIVRNSWGTSWGENGYIYMSRKRNQCGILDAASFVIV
jgi:hypothetical protein